MSRKRGHKSQRQKLKFINQGRMPRTWLDANGKVIKEDANMQSSLSVIKFDDKYGRPKSKPTPRWEHNANKARSVHNSHTRTTDKAKWKDFDALELANQREKGLKND